MFELSAAQRRELRAQAHHLDPVVSIAGNGLSAGVLKEIEAALAAHALIKIRIYGDDRQARIAYLQEICSQLDCAPVQSIGKLLVVYRPKPEPEVKAATPARKNPKPVTGKRPGRPTTHNAPRKALRGEPAQPRFRKAAAGSSRTRKTGR